MDSCRPWKTSYAYIRRWKIRREGSRETAQGQAVLLVEPIRPLQDRALFNMFWKLRDVTAEGTRAHGPEGIACIKYF